VTYRSPRAILGRSRTSRRPAGGPTNAWRTIRAGARRTCSPTSSRCSATTGLSERAGHSTSKPAPGPTLGPLPHRHAGPSPA